MSKPLEGKTAFVSGASSGIGLASARRLAELGARVAVSARRADVLAELADELGRGAQSFPADVAVESEAVGAIAGAWDAFGHIDYLVHAAGILTPSSIEKMSGDFWRRHIDVNLSGSFYTMRECGLRMRERGEGSIVALGSNLSMDGLEDYAHYCAAKAGLAGFAKALALELAPTVRVNCICPGPVDTPMMESEVQWYGGTDEVREKAIADVPLKRMASPEEIAKMIVFIAAEATYTTGSMLSADGGMTCR